MTDLASLFFQGLDELQGRAAGPLHFRLFIMPTVVTVLAIRAGLRDAHEKRSFIWALLTRARDRRALLRTALADLGRVVLVAVILDTTYQLLVLGAFHPIQLVIVVVGCAILPYVLIRGPVGIVARHLHVGDEAAAPVHPPGKTP